MFLYNITGIEGGTSDHTTCCDLPDGTWLDYYRPTAGGGKLHFNRIQVHYLSSQASPWHYMSCVFHRLKQLERAPIASSEREVLACKHNPGISRQWQTTLIFDDK